MKHLYRLAAGLLVCAGSETFDVGIDLGSTVSLDYMEGGRSGSTAGSKPWKCA
jgi:hypothetical protein